MALQTDTVKRDKAVKMYSSDFAQNSHRYFAWMRQNEPVCKARYTYWQKAYVITRYKDVEAALRDERIVKSPPPNGSNTAGAPKLVRPLLHNILLKDGSDHRRLRSLAQKAFTPKLIAGMERRVQAIADGLFTKAQAENNVDLVASFALPLPRTVIADMIGIPEEDRPLLYIRARKIIGSPTMAGIIRAIPPLLSTMKYLQDLLAKRRAEPQDDLLTGMALAQDDQGDRFTDDEVLAMIFTMLAAGFESTVSLIANGTLALLSHRDQFELLKRDFSLMERAIEELLRYDGPLQTAEKSFARETLSVQGVEIPQGSMVLSALLSANRDETAFDRADELNITRTPNRHVAFGHGIHYCLGAPLARLEAKIAFTTLLERAPNLKLLSRIEDHKYRDIMKLHQLDKLPVSLGSSPMHSVASA